MPSFINRFQHVQWARALFGLCISCVAALSVHTVMLQVVKVPYPAGSPAPRWSSFCGLPLASFALLWFCQLAADRLKTLPIPSRLLLVGFLAVMLREGGRLIVMNAVVTTAWRYSFVDGLARPFTMFTLGYLAVLAAPYVQGPARRIGGALLIGALVNYLLSPGVQVLHDHVLQTIASLSHDEVYKVPYGWQVEVPSYITFMEPTIAAFILAAFIWDRLSPRLPWRMLQFAFLVMSVKGILLQPLLYPLSSTFRLPLALLSISQFFFEWLVLAVAVGFTWQWAHRTSLKSA